MQTTTTISISIIIVIIVIIIIIIMAFVWGKVYPAAPRSHAAIAVPTPLDLTPASSAAAAATSAGGGDAVGSGSEAVISCAAGYRHSMLLTASGAVLTWGSNIEGQLGRGGAC